MFGSGKSRSRGQRCSGRVQNAFFYPSVPSKTLRFNNPALSEVTTMMMMVMMKINGNESRSHKTIVHKREKSSLKFLPDVIGTLKWAAFLLTDVNFLITTSGFENNHSYSSEYWHLIWCNIPSSLYFFRSNVFTYLYMLMSNTLS